LIIDYIDPDISIKRFELPIALYPYRFNNRLIAQGGYFTLHGTMVKSLDELAPDTIERIKLPVNAIKEANKFHDLAGINKYTLFPEVEYLCQQIIDTYFD